MVDVATLVGTVANNYIQYVFGSPLLAGAGFMLMFILIGIRFNWGMDLYIITMLPIISYMTGTLMGTGLEPLVLMGVGLLLGLGILAMVKR
jgi:hypothetical protein